jgi:hypothetical protein
VSNAAQSRIEIKVATPDPRVVPNSVVMPVRNARWVLKRAMFGLVMLLTVSVGAAFLLDATIDPSLEQASE